jgi:hypothetical protein
MPKTATDYLFEETKLIQEVINRMGNNSFLVKGWAITLVVATFLFKMPLNYQFIAFLPWLLFWYLDAYFLRIEKLYRHSYDWVILNRKKSKEFLLDLNVKTTEMRFGKSVDPVLKLMFSNATGKFYGLLFIMILIVVIISAFFA